MCLFFFPVVFIVSKSLITDTDSKCNLNKTLKERIYISQGFPTVSQTSQAYSKSNCEVGPLKAKALAGMDAHYFQRKTIAEHDSMFIVIFTIYFHNIYCMPQDIFMSVCAFHYFSKLFYYFCSFSAEHFHGTTNQNVFQVLKRYFSA